MKVALLALTDHAKLLAEKLAGQLAEATLLAVPKGSGIGAVFAQNWEQYDGFVCIMATGIVVRSIAPLLRDKHHDPCVVVLDQEGRYAISLLSGHLGGGNELAAGIADLTGGAPVITTASDNRRLVAFDLWLRAQQLYVAEPNQVTALSALLVNRGELRLFSELPVASLPPGLCRVDDTESADCSVSLYRTTNVQSPVLLYPRNLVVGVGCNRHTPAEEFESALRELFTELRLAPGSIRNLASIDVKAVETGLLEFARNNSWPIDFFTREQLNRQTGVTTSPAAMQAVGAIGVAEPAALLSAQNSSLLCRKRKWKNVTMAIAQVPFTLSAQVQAPPIT
jgi:cobalt-precorrin 5A hydrolase